MEDFVRRDIHVSIFYTSSFVGSLRRPLIPVSEFVRVTTQETGESVCRKHPYPFLPLSV